MKHSRPGRSRKRLVASSLATAVAAGTLLATPAAQGLTSVPTRTGDSWNVHDSAAPGLDTGSVRNTAANALQGFGGLRVHVRGGKSPLNGILLRGFGITSDGRDTFTTTRGVEVDGVVVQRELRLNGSASYGRFFDSFTNTRRTPVKIDIAFGGQLGYGTRANRAVLAGTSSGDDAITGADSWASWYSPSAGAGSASQNGPSATVVGTPGRTEAFKTLGNFLRDPFRNALPTTGDEANHPGIVSQVVIKPGETASLAHFVVTGRSEVRALAGNPIPAAGTEVAAVQSTAADLAATPDFAGLSKGEVCSVVNFDARALGVRPKTCARTTHNAIRIPVAGATPAKALVTTSPYDVVGKSIAQLTADMDSGVTNAQQITRAYLDRIAAYDRGPFGLHAVLAVAPDAMRQAKAADAARKRGDERPLLGIPILVKDIIDTKDMPTTGGSLLFDGWIPQHDAWQVQKLREAGAIILGKANLSKFANSGHFSESDYGQVWNAFDNSRSSIGSSGGSAVALASSFAAAVMGTQSGDSLWGPAGAASLYSLRGTDGMQSSAGTMPLALIQDYVGFMGQSVGDLASLLDVAAVDNPEDVLDNVANGHRPADWTAELSKDSLRGKVIGIPANAFDDPFGSRETSDALRAKFAVFEKAGATIKDIPTAPAAPSMGELGSVWSEGNYEGWEQWLEAHPDSPVGLDQLTSASSGWTDEEQRAVEAVRVDYRNRLAAWMDDNGVDVVLYPTELSDVHLNDSSGNSFGRRDPQSSDAGVPTMIFPAGVNSHDQVVGFQLQGKAFQDAELLGFAYAYEAVDNGRVLPPIAPPLTYDKHANPRAITPMDPLADRDTIARGRALEAQKP